VWPVITQAQVSAAAAAPPASLAKSYSGSARNLTADEAAPITLTGVTQTGGAITGTFAFHAPLAGIGPFTGTITSTKVKFAVKPTTASCPSCSSITFNGAVSPVVSLVGTWVAHLKSGAAQSGTWQVGSTWNGYILSVKFPIALSGVIESSSGHISGSCTFYPGSGGQSHLVGQFSGTIAGSAVQFVCNTIDLSSGSKWVEEFKATFSSVLGGMSGSWTQPAQNGSAARTDSWQVTRSGASAAV